MLLPWWNALIFDIKKPSPEIWLHRNWCLEVISLHDAEWYNALVHLLFLLAVNFALDFILQDNNFSHLLEIHIVWQPNQIKKVVCAQSYQLKRWNLRPYSLVLT